LTGGRRVHLVVPEGLETDPDHPERATDRPSSYYQAVLDCVACAVSAGDVVMLAPANSFGGPVSEHQAGKRYLASRIPDGVQIECPEGRQGSYLDTLDNAVELRNHLEQIGGWPLGPCTLYCNSPHKVRAVLMFKLLEFDIRDIVTTRGRQRSSSIVRRLWFYDYPLLHYLYEAGAIPYTLFRFAYLKVTGK
jgi:hypothetical protein